jgi:hypothetical protein
MSNELVINKYLYKGGGGGVNYWQLLSRNTSEKIKENHDKSLDITFGIYFSNVDTNFKISRIFVWKICA